MSRRVIIESIVPASTLQGAVSAQEWSTAQGFKSQKRRDEWLSWRASLRRELGEGVEIEYRDTGAPYIVNSQLHIGVSHTRNRVAIIISDAPCAIDIELVSRDFAGVSSRYISDCERAVIEASNEPYLLAIAWCAKEAGYKYAGGETVDFIKDIAIESIDTESKKIRIKILESSVEAEWFAKDDYVAVTIG